MQIYHSPISTGAAAGAVCWAKVGLTPEAADHHFTPRLFHSPTWAIFVGREQWGIPPRRAVVDDFGTLVGVPS